MIEIPVDQPLNKGLEQGLLFGTPPVERAAGIHRASR